MKNTIGAVLFGTALVAAAPPVARRDVDTRFPYTGPTVPVGDWVDPTVNGNGKGFPRLVEAPAVKPNSANPTNNVNVISLAYVPGGMHIHFQTPFGLGAAPKVQWGTTQDNLCNTAVGQSNTYAREPPCSLAPVTQCSEFFHEVQITGLKPNTKYWYRIPAANGTTESQTLSFRTAHAAGDRSEFTVAVLNDMGYTNAHGTHKYLGNAVDDGLAFAWHGGDISYADDWYSGILPCESSWPVCYNGSSTRLPGGPPYPAEYLDAPLPAG
ncbi:acid phosphatase AphA, partial [Aureobasidium melanogenum]